MCQILVCERETYHTVAQMNIGSICECTYHIWSENPELQVIILSSSPLTKLVPISTGPRNRNFFLPELVEHVAGIYKFLLLSLTQCKFLSFANCVSSLTKKILDNYMTKCGSDKRDSRLSHINE